MTRQLISATTGKVPSVALINPKYGHNAAGALRACAAFGMKQLWITGERVQTEWAGRGRWPREERMRAYQGVEVIFGDYFFDGFPRGTVPVGVEIRENAEPLTYFEHPDRALYVFGPEDGGLSGRHLMHCHRVVIIPSDHCLNLACAVNVMLAHRRMTRQLAGLEQVRPSNATLNEQRGWLDDDATLAEVMP